MTDAPDDTNAPDDPDDPGATGATGENARAGWPAWAERYVEAVRDVLTVGEAARLAGVHRSTVKRLRDRDEAFVLAEHDAREAGLDRLERVFYHRATLGEPRVKTVTTEKLDAQGKVVERVTTTTEETYVSDTVGMFLLKRYRPEFRESFQLQHTGSGGGPVAVRVERKRSPQRVEALLEVASQMGWAPPAGNGSGA